MKKAIFEYDDYRKFLSDFYKAEKKKAPDRFSFRYFARRAGFTTSSVFPLVMQGKRNLSFQSAQRFASAIGLNKRETEYFSTLVFYNQEKDPAQKVEYFKKMIAFREYRKVRVISKEQIKYFSKWYYPVIREMVNVAGFIADPKWIAARIQPPITPSEAKSALALLRKLDLIRQDSDGRWAQAEKHVVSNEDHSPMGLLMFHQNMIQLGLDSLKQHPTKREVSGMTMSVSHAAFEQIKARIRQWQEEVQAVISKDDKQSPVDRVCQLNFQLFHLAGEQEGI